MSVLPATYTAGLDRYEAIGRLTPRELEVLRLTAQGLQRREIARVLVVQYSSVCAFTERVRKKLRAHTMAQCVAVAYERGLLP